MNSLFFFSSPHIFDVIFLLIVIFMFFVGKKRGAVRVVTGLFGTLAAWIGASALSPSLTPLTVRLVTPYASSAISRGAEAMGLTPVLDTAVAISDGMAQTASSLLTLGEKLSALGMPEQLSELAGRLGVTGTLESMVPETAVTLTPAELLTQAMVAKIAPIATFFILFILIKAAISIVSRLLSLDWPIFSSLNHMAGGLIGLLGGALLVLALCAGILTWGTAEEAGLTSAVMLRESFIGGFAARFIG